MLLFCSWQETSPDEEWTEGHRKASDVTDDSSTGSALFNEEEEEEDVEDVVNLEEEDPFATLGDEEAKENEKDESMLPVHHAAYDGELELVKKLLPPTTTSAGDATTPRDGMGWSILHFAAYKGHREVVECLVNEVGMPVIDYDSIGWTPLHYASYQGHPRVVDYLIAQGGLEYEEQEGGNGMHPVHLAAASGHLEIIEALMCEGEGAGEFIDEGGMTPLHWAAKKSHLHVLKYLVEEKGMYVEAVDDEGKTPSDYAETPEVRDWLLRHHHQRDTTTIHASNSSAFTAITIHAEEEKEKEGTAALPLCAIAEGLPSTPILMTPAKPRKPMLLRAVHYIDHAANAGDDCSSSSGCGISAPEIVDVPLSIIIHTTADTTGSATTSDSADGVGRERPPHLHPPHPHRPSQQGRFWGFTAMWELPRDYMVSGGIWIFGGLRAGWQSLQHGISAITGPLRKWWSSRPSSSSARTSPYP